MSDLIKSIMDGRRERGPCQEGARKLVVTGVVDHLDNCFISDKDDGCVWHHSDEVGCHPTIHSPHSLLPPHREESLDEGMIPVGGGRPEARMMKPSPEMTKHPTCSAMECAVVSQQWGRPLTFSCLGVQTVSVLSYKPLQGKEAIVSAVDTLRATLSRRVKVKCRSALQGLLS